MTKTDNIRILTWNARGYNSETSHPRDEIVRQKPPVALIKETMMWIVNDEVLNWAGATVPNMEALQKINGKRGGLVIIVSLEIEFNKLYRCAIGVDLEALKGSEIDPEHVQLCELFNYRGRNPRWPDGSWPKHHGRRSKSNSRSR